MVEQLLRNKIIPPEQVTYFGSCTVDRASVFGTEQENQEVVQYHEHE